MTPEDVKTAKIEADKILSEMTEVLEAHIKSGSPHVESLQKRLKSLRDVLTTFYAAEYCIRDAQQIAQIIKNSYLDAELNIRTGKGDISFSEVWGLVGDKIKHILNNK